MSRTLTLLRFAPLYTVFMDEMIGLFFGGLVGSAPESSCTCFHPIFSLLFSFFFSIIAVFLFYIRELPLGAPSSFACVAGCVEVVMRENGEQSAVCDHQVHHRRWC